MASHCDHCDRKQIHTKLDGELINSLVTLPLITVPLTLMCTLEVEVFTMQPVTPLEGFLR